jgi:ABC-2 type transport system permease protein
MTWATVARKEFADAVRSRMLWAIVVVLAVMTSLAAGLSRLIPEVPADATLAVGAAAQFAALLVPILALIAAYLAIAGERESGSLKMLLGLPPSRREVLTGKFVGRSGVVAVGLALGFAVSGVATRVLYGDLPLAGFLVVTALTVLLGVAFVGVAVGISAVTATRARAMTLAVAAYLGLTLLWDLFPQGLVLVVTGAMPGETVPAWFLLVQALSPSGAYNALVQVVLAGGPGAMAARLAGPAPAYLDPLVFLAILLAWTVVPLLVGYDRFRRADLG